MTALARDEIAPKGERPKARADVCLSLSAAPTFAMMALFVGLQDDGSAATICAPGTHASALTGMAAMYLLMSVFHAPPWLRLASRWRGTGAR